MQFASDVGVYVVTQRVLNISPRHTLAFAKFLRVLGRIQTKNPDQEFLTRVDRDLTDIMAELEIIMFTR
jgi:hypothetical protein